MRIHIPKYKHGKSRYYVSAGTNRVDYRVDGMKHGLTGGDLFRTAINKHSATTSSKGHKFNALSKNCWEELSEYLRKYEAMKDPEDA